MEIKKRDNPTILNEHTVFVTDDIYVNIGQAMDRSNKYFILYQQEEITDILGLACDKPFATPQDAAQYILEKTRDFLTRNIAQLDE